MFRRLVTSLYRYLFNRDQIKRYYYLKKLELSDAEKHHYQLEKVKQVLKEAIAGVPFYNGYRIDIENLNYQEFQKLPVLTKSIMRGSGESLINHQFKDVKDIVKNTSGGSTGEPLEFFQTKYSQKCGLANFYFANYLNGISPYDSSVDFWGALRDMNHTGDTSFRASCKEYLQNKKSLNTYVLNNEIIEKYIKIINEFQPRFIKAYVHSLFDISKYINSRNIKISFTPIIHTTTGPLYPEMRAEISEAFNGAFVYSFYGSREVSAIATETKEHDGMQVMYDNVFVEILDENDQPVEKGEEGEIVITTLNNFYMPLIRYRIGDRAIKGDRHFGTLRLGSVLGRTLGVIHKQGGGYIDGQYFTTLFFGLRTIKSFQVVQKELNIIHLNIVRAVDYNDSDLDSLISNIKRQLGENVMIKINYCDRINLTATGKIMYVYSELDI